jgi:zinc-ribbon domain
MKPCPNCGQPVESLVALCPNCGADTRALWHESVPSEAPVILFGQRRKQDRIEMGVGFSLALVLSCVFPWLFIGSVLSVAIGAFKHRTHPAFSKGMYLGSAAGALGAIYICSRISFPGISLLLGRRA